MHYIKYAQDGSIAMAADWPFPGSQPVDFEVERGYDGRLYKAGEAPVKPAAEVEAEAFAALRAERDERLKDYDKATAQIQRDMRLANVSEKSALAELLAKWDTYAKALCDLPEQDGAPWDGGGSETPWPEEPIH